MFTSENWYGKERNRAEIWGLNALQNHVLGTHMMFGVLAAMLTPIDDNGRIDCRRFSDLAEALLAEGCNGLVPFGTTGEFSCFSVRERMDALNAMIDSGVDASKIIAGTGASALSDVVDLSRHAMDRGCSGVLVGPPFYFKNVRDEALYATYASLIEGVGESMRLYLYHFPEMTCVPIPYTVIVQLLESFPKQLAGLKDSAGDFDYSRKLIENFPDLSVFTGDDDLLLANLKAGGAGSITAGANLAVRELTFIRDHWRDEDTAAVDDKDRLLRALWTGLLLNYPVTEALKEIFAAKSSAASWLNMSLPLMRLGKHDRAQLLADFANLVIEMPDNLFRQ